MVNLTHGNHIFTAKVFGNRRSHSPLIGEENITVELDYAEILKIEILPEFKDEISEIRKIDDYFSVKGTIINIIESHEEKLVDIYLQTGPEFLQICLPKTHDFVLKKEIGLLVLLSDLRFYPTNY